MLNFSPQNILAIYGSGDQEAIPYANTDSHLMC